MAKKPLYLEIFLTCLGALLLEISYTRIFSFKVFYYFTYLVLGVGLLGIGAGGIAVATSERLRRMAPERLLPLATFGAGASVLLGYMLVAPTELNIAQSVTTPGELGKLVFVSLLLTLTFFLVGLVVSTILSANPEASGKLYGADLLGAAAGCTAAVPVLTWLDPPRTIMLAGLILTLAGIRLALPSKKVLGLGIATAMALAVPLAWGGLLPDPVVANSKGYEDFRKGGLIKYSRWHPVFRVDVAQHPFYPGNVFLLFHDGQPGSGLRRFDGTFKGFEYLQKDARSLPFSVLPPEPKVLIIGAAGGHEIVASLNFGAGHITGVELNPVTYDVVTNVFADISGRLGQHPKVTYLNGDGRWFLKQTEQKFDLIWFVAPDSYAAMNAATSGAFVLSESYLYTAEMIKEGLKHLSDNGIVCTQFGEIAFDKKPNRTARYLSTARAAFKEMGIPNFQDHVLLASAPGFPPYKELAVLLGKKAFSPEQIMAFQMRNAGVEEGVVRYVPGMTPNENPAVKAITLPAEQLPGWFEKHPYQIDPVRDDAPFFWHFARFRDAVRAPWAGAVEGQVIDHEDTVAEQITVAFLGVVVLLASIFLLLPLFTIRQAWLEMPKKALALTYFASLGLGFMFIEIALIQKLTLLLGYPTYSLSVTLFAILVFSGLGSLLSSRWAHEPRRALIGTLAVLSVWVLLAQALLPPLIDAFVGSSLPVRVAVTVLMVAPVGLCLGGFMPLGLTTVSEITTRPREYVAWAWAVNGFFSVIASILSTILAMVIGFRWLLVVALLVYLVGALALSRLFAFRRVKAA